MLRAHQSQSLSRKIGSVIDGLFAGQEMNLLPALANTVPQTHRTGETPKSPFSRRRRSRRTVTISDGTAVKSSWF